MLSDIITRNYDFATRIVNLITEYSQQYDWRSWPTILDALPDLDGRLVLDLGCGIGDLAANLSARGAHVIGVDINEELISYANNRQIANAQFRVADLCSFRDPYIRADGIWSSFTAAYFPSLPDTIGLWLAHLRPGGWVALTEVDDLFGHQPLSHRTRELLLGYVDDSLENSRYDFHMGRKLAGVLQQAGLVVAHEFAVPDAELCFAGPASPAVFQAWRARLDRMHLLREFCGSDFEHVRNEFLHCLNRTDHSCNATVRCCIGNKMDSGHSASRL